MGVGMVKTGQNTGIIFIVVATLRMAGVSHGRSRRVGSPPGYAILLILAFFLLVHGGCDGTGISVVQGGGAIRTYRMGFTGIPPRADISQAIAAIDMWSLRADAALMSYELPWDSLLAGVLPETLIARDQLGLADYYRYKGHEIWVYLDPANGLNRSGESDVLVRLGRSITEPAIQQVFRRYAVVLDSMVRPAHLGLALETNLIRGLASPALYDAIRVVVNAAAADVRAVDSVVKLSVSVQVDYAWGRFGGTVYEGVETDFTDFPFIEELGLSSYPYLAGFTVPEDIPDDYYLRIPGGRIIPVMVTEGGWSSATLDTMVSSQDEQRRYIEKHSHLLDTVRATAVFQLTFTDLDLVSIAPPPGSILRYFAYLGLVDIDLHPKLALASWDGIFARTLTGTETGVQQ